MRIILLGLKAIGISFIYSILLILFCFTMPIGFVVSLISLIGQGVEYITIKIISKLKAMSKQFKLDMKTAITLLVFTSISPITLAYLILALILIKLYRIDRRINLYISAKLKTLTAFLKNEKIKLKKELKIIGKMEV